eukprot:3833245-Alexandrium_andersonii.AAC.1
MLRPHARRPHPPLGRAPTQRRRPRDSPGRTIALRSTDQAVAASIARPDRCCVRHQCCAHAGGNSIDRWDRPDRCAARR